MKFATLLLVSVLGIVQCSNSSIPVTSKNLVPQNAYNIAKSCRARSIYDPEIKLIQPQRGFGQPFEVMCDSKYEGGGWIVIQQRFSGSVDFFRGWKDYENGFGNMQGEFWLGLKKIHELTYSDRFELHVVLADWEGNTVTAKYSRFLVAGPEEKYLLRSLGKYSGTAGDSLSYSLNMKFSTFDADNDLLEKENCARVYSGAWWYRGCHESNLNGLYVEGQVPDFANMMCWKAFRGYYYGLHVSRMLIREVE